MTATRTTARDAAKGPLEPSSIPWRVDPTPNKANEQHGRDGERIFKVVSAAPYGGLIADVSAWWVDPATAEANAHFIVRAVNSHAELLEALRIMLQHLDQHPEALAMIGPGNAEYGRAALAKAERRDV